MTSLAHLIDALEKLTGPDRDLGDQCLYECGWKTDEEDSGPNRTIWWIAPNGDEHLDGDQPDPTASLDAALTLVPEGCGYRITKRTDDGRFDVVVASGLTEAMIYVEANGAITAATGTSAAALRARAALSDYQSEEK